MSTAGFPTEYCGIYKILPFHKFMYKIWRHLKIQNTTPLLKNVIKCVRQTDSKFTVKKQKGY